MDLDILDEYLERWPHSLTRRQINIDDDEQMAELLPAMKRALSIGEPLTDDIFNAPEGADL